MDFTGKLTLEDVGSFLAKFAEKSNSMVYWLSSPDFAKIQYISPSYEIIWDRPRQVLYDEPELWITYLHPDDATDHHPIHAMRDRVAQLGAQARYDESYRIVRPDGSIRWIVDRGFPLMDDAGRCLGVTGVAVDVTSHHHAKELAFEVEAVEKKAGYIKTAAGTIAHDLKTPLAGIRMGIDLSKNTLEKLVATYQIARDAGLDIPTMNDPELERMVNFSKLIRKEIDFAVSYTNLILNNLKYDVIDSSKYQNYNVAHVVGDALEGYPYRQGEEEKIHWTPKVDFPFWGNDLYLKNIINNLLKNSLYYIREVERGEIFVWTQEDEESHNLYFKDTAKGAPLDILAKMFDGYYTTRDKGTGLGLAFCKSIMVSFGGDVTVESVEGDYITFRLMFPKQHKLNEKQSIKKTSIHIP